MIKNVFVNGIQVNSSKCYLQELGNIASAQVDFSDYQRGGTSGQILSRPLYKGLTINMSWFVKGAGLNDFITQRDRLISYFQNKETTSDYFKTLGFELNNGTIKEVDVLFSQVSGGLDSNNIAYSTFDLTAVSEQEFLTSRTEKTAIVAITIGGGMSIPMPIPMDMSVGGSTDETILTNDGNANSYPTIIVYGDLTTAFNLINDTTGETLTYTGTLGASDYVELDFYNRTAILNGANSALGNISGDWWKIAPGTNVVRITSGLSLDGGYATFTYKDSYRNI